MSIEFSIGTFQDRDAIRTFLNQSDCSFSRDSSIKYGERFYEIYNSCGQRSEFILFRDDSRIVGLAARCRFRGRVNGSEATLTYLGDLRLQSKHRRGTVLARGYRYLRQITEAEKCDCYLTVINERNEIALDVLTSGRAGLPQYRDLGRVTVFVLSSASSGRNDGPALDGSRSDLTSIIDFLNADRHQFSRAYTEGDLFPGGAAGFSVEQFCLTKRHGVINAVAAVWDQRQLRELFFRGYPPVLDAIRVAAEGMGIEILPSPGKPLPVGYLSFLSGDDPVDVHAVMVAACRKAERQGLAAIMVALHERDPRADLASEMSRSEVGLRLFAVDLGKGLVLDDRVPFVEAALL